MSLHLDFYEAICAQALRLGVRLSAKDLKMRAPHFFEDELARAGLIKFLGAYGLKVQLSDVSPAHITPSQVLCVWVAAMVGHIS